MSETTDSIETTPPSPEWLAVQGRQVLELIAASGFDVGLTLRMLIEVETGYPLSSPPKWCETGCALASERGDCTIIDMAMRHGGDQTVAGKEWERRLNIQQRWNGVHEWDGPDRLPKHGILYDCPCYQGPT